MKEIDKIVIDDFKGEVQKEAIGCLAGCAPFFLFALFILFILLVIGIMGIIFE